VAIRCLYVASPFLSGLDVRAVQATLKAKWNIDCGKIDGVYGPKTEDAVKKFQGRRGLGKTGYVNSTTFNHLTRM
jgi:peptidoglycan hydrolase-like protein with peptidoglycan-binding domain